MEVQKKMKESVFEQIDSEQSEKVFEKENSTSVLNTCKSTPEQIDFKQLSQMHSDLVKLFSMYSDILNNSTAAIRFLIYTITNDATKIPQGTHRTCILNAAKAATSLEEVLYEFFNFTGNFMRIFKRHTQLLEELLKVKLKFEEAKRKAMAACSVLKEENRSTSVVIAMQNIVQDIEENLMRLSLDLNNSVLTVGNFFQKMLGMRCTNS